MVGTTLFEATRFIGVLPEHMGDTLGMILSDGCLHHATTQYISVYRMILIWLNTRGYTTGVTPTAKSYTRIPG